MGLDWPQRARAFFAVRDPWAERTTLYEFFRAPAASLHKSAPTVVRIRDAGVAPVRGFGPLSRWRSAGPRDERPRGSRSRNDLEHRRRCRGRVGFALLDRPHH